MYTQAEAKTLLEAAGVFFDEADEVGSNMLNMNDVWGWACPDCEKVPDGNLVEVATLFHHYGWAGILYWVSEQRGGARSEFLDNNRFIDFVRHEEQLCKDEPESNRRAYHKLVYTLGEDAEPTPR